MNSDRPKRKPLFSITAVLVFGSAGATLIAVGLALFLGFTSAAKNTFTLLYGQSEQLIDGLTETISQELTPIQRQAAFVAQQVREGAIDPRDTLEWQRYVEAIPAATPQVATIGFISRTYDASVYAVRAGELVQINLGHFEQVRKVIDGVTNPMRPQWHRPALAPRSTKIELMIWVPLFVDGEYIGIYFEAVAAAALTRRLTRQTRGSGITPFILYDNSWVLMHANIPQWQRDQENYGSRPPPLAMRPEDVPLPEIDQLGDPILSNFWTAKRAFIDRDAGKTLTRVTQAPLGDNRFIYVFRHITDYGKRPWIIGGYFSESLRSDVFETMRDLVIGGIIVIILAVGVAIIIGKLTARPVLRLAHAASAFREGDLNDVPYVAPSRLKEMDEAATSFNHMIDGLKERETIRNLFGKYVPERVAEKLLAADGALEPQAAEATILFVDLAGFTNLSEQLKPQEIVDILNTYFSAVVDIIEQNSGVITQFQGDAILAIFNVPMPDEDHAAHAINAAREIHREINGSLFIGQKLSCRIGINTGSVIAGNVGAQARLNYTVHGDAVNLAARLEQLNKEFGTGTLVSASTVALVSGENFEPKGEVDIRGKVEKVTVYSFTD
ncbi:MAG: adenylate/guanylate cyclase domain-containing protein [Rhodospirillaceae bacterium]|jgi:adenylate cyclase|nr:adenylate/guanylate cyclase domain-containing protein [Rhodospirillaceae bacterium]MBT7954505.1 adenylate/guanylate cyclase domain-containing protein [Rhodospirillaceae bacterium]